MSFRFCLRLNASRRIYQRLFTVNNKTKSFNSNSQNLKEIDLAQSEIKEPQRQTVRRRDDTPVTRQKVKPIGLLYPSSKFTKSARTFEKFAVNSCNEDGFTKAIEEYKKSDLHRLRVIDFISTSVRYMELFEVSKNIDIYNTLLNIFPKGHYHYKTVFDTVWTRYRPQIDSAIHLLTKMEENGVRPNVDTYDIVHAVFGVDSIPMDKLKRIVFWFDKVDEMYPHPLPPEMPTEQAELYKLAVRTMFGETAPILEYKHNEADTPKIVGSHGLNIQKKLEEYDDKQPLFVEGPFSVWLRKNQLFYYVLQMDDCSSDVEDDCVLATCFIGGNEEELKIWLNELQNMFPALAKFNIIFNMSNN